MRKLFGPVVNAVAVAVVIAGGALGVGGCSYRLDRGQDLKPGDVDGIAVDAEDLSAAAGFSRIVVEGNPQVRRAGADGAFRLSGMPAGTFALALTRDLDGDGIPERAARRTVTITHDADGKLGFLLLGNVGLGGVADVVGTAVDDVDGSAIPGARVVAVRVDGAATDVSVGSSTGDALAISGGDGAFRVRGLAPGDVQVVAFLLDDAGLARKVSAPRQVRATPDGPASANNLVLVDATNTTTPVQLSFADGADGTSAGDIDVFLVPAGTPDVTALTGAAFARVPSGAIAALDVPLGLWDLHARSVDGKHSGALLGQAAHPGAGVALWGPLLLLAADPCSRSDDVDGDGLRALPDPAVDARPWVGCRDQCQAQFGASAGAASCQFEGATFDCDDDGDLQPDVTEDPACLGACAGADRDGDRVCDVRDPDPGCAYDDASATKCTFEKPPALPEYGGPPVDAGPAPDGGDFDGGEVDGGVAVCANGNVEEGEACDDGAQTGVPCVPPTGAVSCTFCNATCTAFQTAQGSGFVDVHAVDLTRFDLEPIAFADVSSVSAVSVLDLGTSDASGRLRFGTIAGDGDVVVVTPSDDELGHARSVGVSPYSVRQGEDSAVVTHHITACAASYDPTGPFTLDVVSCPWIDAVAHVDVEVGDLAGAGVIPRLALAPVSFLVDPSEGAFGQVRALPPTNVDLAGTPGIVQCLAAADVEGKDEAGALTVSALQTLNLVVDGQASGGQTLSAWHFDTRAGHFVDSGAVVVESVPGEYTTSIDALGWWCVGFAEVVGGCVAGTLAGVDGVTPIAAGNVRARIGASGVGSARTADDGTFCIDVPGAAPVDLESLVIAGDQRLAARGTFLDNDSGASCAAPAACAQAALTVVDESPRCSDVAFTFTKSATTNPEISEIDVQELFDGGVPVHRGRVLPFADGHRCALLPRRQMSLRFTDVLMSTNCSVIGNDSVDINYLAAAGGPAEVCGGPSCQLDAIDFFCAS